MKGNAAYEIAVTDTTGRASRHRRIIRDVVEAGLRAHRVTRATVAVAIVDDMVMARLHRRYLGRRGPTDVLTFDLAGRNGGTERKGRAARRPFKIIEGEIVLSLDTGRHQAARRRHSTAAELALYALHGVLHLLGYDDRRRADAARMHALEDKLLTSIGFGAVFACLHVGRDRNWRTWAVNDPSTIADGRRRTPF